MENDVAGKCCRDGATINVDEKPEVKERMVDLNLEVR